MARRRRVLVFYHSPLFAASLKSLLEREEGLEVATGKASAPEGRQMLLSFRPHVLIVEESAIRSQEEGDCIHGGVGNVIHLSLHDSAMRVYYERRVPSADPRDLIEAVKGREPSVKGRRHRQ